MKSNTKEIIIELINNDFSLQEIADALDISYPHTRLTIKNLGLLDKVKRTLKNEKYDELIKRLDLTALNELSNISGWSIERIVKRRIKLDLAASIRMEKEEWLKNSKLLDAEDVIE